MKKQKKMHAAYALASENRKESKIMHLNSKITNQKEKRKNACGLRLGAKKHKTFENNEFQSKTTYLKEKTKRLRRAQGFQKSLIISKQ